MRFVIAIIVIALIAVVGLYAYSWTLKPDTRVIEQDAILSADA